MKDLDKKQEFTFITEKVKERPLNRKKLIRKMLGTVAMAVIFGLIACFTFLVLEPVLSNWLYPQEEIEMVEIPEVAEEILPEDMLVHEETVLEPSQEVIDTLKNEIQLDIKDYQQLYQNIHNTVQGLQSAMVTVTSVSQDIDWFNDPYESTDQTNGFLFAQNNQELMILVVLSELNQTDELEVSFMDGTKVPGEMKGTDTNTGLGVVAVQKELLPEHTMESSKFVTLGSSRLSTLIASPVIALGKPLGKASAIYGMITSVDTTLNMTDRNFKLLTTDIYGSTDASGVLVDFSGRVVGVINQNHNSETAFNAISAIGITELKAVLQRMSNGLENSYLGIKGTDVPTEIHKNMGVPMGAYVTGIVMDSPAMTAGIQSGDIITQINHTNIQSFESYSEVLEELIPGEIIELTLMRQGQTEYHKVELEVTVGSLE